jgi:ribosomal protein L22
MEQWKAERLMKKAKKQARKQLMKEGHHPKTAARLVNQALKRIHKEAQEND